MKLITYSLKAVATVIGLIILITLFVKFIGPSGKELEYKMLDRPRTYLNKKVVLDKDTLRIVDYSIWNSNYILSNRTEVAWELIDSLLIRN